MRKRENTISQPSIPIIYYGDLNQYNKSSPKIITVGLNPFDLDFPSDTTYIKFLDTENNDLSRNLDEDEHSRYLKELNNYFKIEPFWICRSLFHFKL